MKPNIKSVYNLNDIVSHDYRHGTITNADKYARYLNSAINAYSKITLGKQGLKIIKAKGGENSQSFLSTIDWSPQTHFKGTVPKLDDESFAYGKGHYSKEMADALQSHVPEYIEIERLAKADGTWNKEVAHLSPERQRAWIQMHSKAFKNSGLDPEVWYSGQSIVNFREPELGSIESKAYNAAYGTRDIWTSDDPRYAQGFAYKLGQDGMHNRQDRVKLYGKGAFDINGGVVLELMFPKSTDKDFELNPEDRNKDKRYLQWNYMPYNKIFQSTDDEDKYNWKERTSEGLLRHSAASGNVKTDDLVNSAKDAGYQTIRMNSIDDGLTTQNPNYNDEDYYWNKSKVPLIINEKVRIGGENSTKVVSPLYNTGDFKGESNGHRNIYAYLQTSKSNFLAIARCGGKLNYLNYVD